MKSRHHLTRRLLAVLATGSAGALFLSACQGGGNDKQTIIAFCDSFARATIQNKNNCDGLAKALEEHDQKFAAFEKRLADNKGMAEKLKTDPEVSAHCNNKADIGAIFGCMGSPAMKAYDKKKKSK